MVISGTDLSTHVIKWGGRCSERDAMWELAKVNEEFKLAFEKKYVKYTVVK